ncbi:hypothetical protein pb186bvf_008917 [Paramecium bursaria]
MFLILFLLEISSSCLCSDHKSSSKCEQTGYCQWLDDQCYEGQCKVQTTKCIAPKCVRSNDGCLDFNKNMCQLLGQQHCTQYPGCYYDYVDQTCQKIIQCNQLKTYQCNGSIDGKQCVVDQWQGKCTEFAECEDLTTNACTNQFPQCVYNQTTNQCQSLDCQRQSNSTCLINQECVLNRQGCLSVNKCYMTDNERECQKVGCYWDTTQCTDCPSSKFQLMVMLCCLMIIYI